MKLDIIGTALMEFSKNPKQQEIVTISDIAGKDTLPVTYFFRNYNEMPNIEKKALNLCKGKVLDVGCAAGSHSLYLQNKGIHVEAMDISEGAINVVKDRGIQNAFVKNIYELETKPLYDTILVLMNGTGICGQLSKLAQFLNHLASLLNKNGQILIDSSDIIYMYENDEGEHWIDASKDYYGEVRFQMSYNHQTSESFDWLYVDYNTLQRCAMYNGLDCELIEEGEHYDYLAKITKSN